MTRTITIVTPTRNAAAYLVETIDSVRAESSDDLHIEHLFVDSGSTDGTLEILKEHDCQVIEVPPVNVNYSTNVGMRAATGEAIGFLGGDDLLMPGAGRAVLDWVDHREHGWLVGAIHWTNADGGSIGVLRPPPNWMTVEMYASLGWSNLPAQTAWFTPGWFTEMGGFPEDFEHIGDYYFFSRALRHGPFDRTTAQLATFRRHGRNMSMTAGEARLDELARIQEEFAPASEAKRTAYRYLIKAWTNGANPAWMLHKRFDAVLPNRPVP